MPSAQCPCCGATYRTPKTGPNGPVCRYCIASGQIVVLLPTTERSSRRFSRPRRAPSDRAPHHAAPLPPRGGRDPGRADNAADVADGRL